MEEILNKILNRLDSIDNRFESVETRLARLEEGQQSMQLVQGEIRKEVAFYFGTLMKELDQTKSELLNEIKDVSKAQLQQPDLLEV